MNFVTRVILKAGALFIVLNSLFALVNPMDWLNDLTLYGVLFPARERLPYAENPSESYSVTLLDVDALFASHEITKRDKAPDEYRVVFVGDSGIWGWLLEPDQTLSACINSQPWQTASGAQIRAYNLGYPVLDATKDLLMIQKALDYQPDMVVWFVTLAALYPDEQLFHEVVRANPEEVRALTAQYNLNLDVDTLPPKPNFWEQTIIGQRRQLADWWRHQWYGIAWTTTGIDHRNPNFFEPVRENLRDGTSLFDGTTEQAWTRQNLSIDVLEAGYDLATREGVEVVFINEPIYISSGINSDLRYNFYYPRWAYDGYRALMTTLAAEQNWHYLDFWDVMPASEFTDSSLHLNAVATCQFAAMVGEGISTYAR